VTPLRVKSQINSLIHKKGTVKKEVESKFAIQVNTFTLVGIPIKMVADEKYTLESKSMPTEYI